MSNRFCPGRVDYEGTMARHFNAGRAVSPHAQQVWRSANGMRQIAAVDGRHSNASYVGGRGEQLPFKASSFDVALLSNVYHHIFDRPSCAEELSRVLRAGGWVLIRGVFADRLGEITLFDYFPEAKVVCEQFPTLPEVLVEAGHEQ